MPPLPVPARPCPSLPVPARPCPSLPVPSHPCFLRLPSRRALPHSSPILRCRRRRVRAEPPGTTNHLAAPALPRLPDQPVVLTPVSNSAPLPRAPAGRHGSAASPRRAGLRCSWILPYDDDAPARPVRPTVYAETKTPLSVSARLQEAIERWMEGHAPQPNRHRYHPKMFIGVPADTPAFGEGVGQVFGFKHRVTAGAESCCLRSYQCALAQHSILGVFVLEPYP
jgi:hypothetical protein